MSRRKRPLVKRRSRGPERRRAPRAAAVTPSKAAPRSTKRGLALAARGAELETAKMAAAADGGICYYRKGSGPWNSKPASDAQECRLIAEGRGASEYVFR